MERRGGSLGARRGTGSDRNRCDVHTAGTPNDDYALGALHVPSKGQSVLPTILFS